MPVVADYLPLQTGPLGHTVQASGGASSLLGPLSAWSPPGLLHDSSLSGEGAMKAPSVEPQLVVRAAARVFSGRF